MTNEALVLSLAGELGVGVLVDPDFLDEAGEATGAAGEDPDGIPFIVLTQPPVDEPSLLVALHELGHWATRFGPRGGDRWRTSKRLDLEVDAWEWALSKAPILTLEGAKNVYEAVSMYLGHRRYVRTTDKTKLRAWAFLLHIAEIIDRLTPSEDT